MRMFPKLIVPVFEENHVKIKSNIFLLLRHIYFCVWVYVRARARDIHIIRSFIFTVHTLL